MEDLINPDIIKQHQQEFVGRIFTQVQLDIIKKRLQKKALDSNEKTYYYKYIKPKLKAMFLFTGMNHEYIHGKEHMLQERIPTATKILQNICQKHKNQKILLSGSFLFNKTYNDIDVFVFSKYKKEDYKHGNIHINFLPESALDSLFFCSLQQISICNFYYSSKKEFAISLEDFFQRYEILINYLLNKKECKQELRQFLLEAEYYSKKVILNPKQLHLLLKIISQKDTVTFLSNMFINTLAYNNSKVKLKKNLLQRIKDYAHLLTEYKHANNVKMYLQTYKEAMKIAL